MNAYEHAVEGYGCGGIDTVECPECGKKVLAMDIVYHSELGSVCFDCKYGRDE